MTDAWLPDLTRAPGIKYQAIADALASAIERGELRRGDRLPPQRDLAARLGVDLTTITRAYDTARSRGLIEARGRAGSFVRDAAAEPSVPPPPDAGMNMPPELPGGQLARAIATTSAALLEGNPGRLHYQAPGGAPQDRAVAAALLARRGIPAAEERVVIAAGGQNALHAILSAGFSPGEAIACGRHVYPGFRALAARLELRLVPLDEMSAAALDEACAREAVRGLYVVPTNDNPTTLTLSLAEREAVTRVAERHELWLVEDDAYGALAADRIAPIAALAPERSWHIASCSKILSPALRVAHVHAPGVGAALRLAGEAHETAVMAPPLNVALVSAWIEDGSFDRLVAAMRAEASRRQALAAELLRGLDVAGHPQGYHLWLRLPAGLAPVELAEAMRPAGLSLIPGERFAVASGGAQAARIALGGPIDADRLARALRLLHAHVSAPAPRSAGLI